MAPVGPDQNESIKLQEEVVYTFEGVMHKQIHSNRCAEALLSKVKYRQKSCYT